MLTKIMVIKLIISYANLLGVDPNLALAIAETESKFNPMAVGALGELSVFQIRVEYTHLNKQQLQGTMGIYEGIRLLKETQKACQSLGEAWFICHNLGKSGGKKIKYPKQFVYYQKVMYTYNNRLAVK